MDIEVLAVSKISSIMANCPHLKPHIATNDKTPFTDGHVDLYSGTRRRKLDWRGRVPVQVKGRTRQPAQGPSLHHSIDRTDLLAFQKDSGVLYFVVAIDPHTANGTPYYAILSPFKIEWILKMASEDQGKISVLFTELPSDPDKIERIVALTLKRRDENVSLGFDPVLFEHAQSLTVHTISDLNFDAPIMLTPATSDFALVIHTRKGLSVPLGGELHIYPQDYVKRSIDLQVRSGTVTYDGATIRRTGKESFEMKVADNLTFSVQNADGNQTTNVSITLANTLADRLKTLEFYLALLDTEAIEFNGNQSAIKVTESADDAWLRKHVDVLRKLNELFDHLSVDTRLIDLDQIEDTQLRQLKILHRAFVGGNEVTDPSGQTARVVQRVGQWHLMFLMSPGTAPAKWQLVDPFSADFGQQFRWSAEGDGVEEAIPVTAYDAVDDELVGTVLNSRLDSIVRAYETITDFPTTYGLANQQTIALISAADRTDARREELLRAAELLNDWLISEQGEEHIHLINRWQILWRRGELSNDERSAIRALKRQLVRDDVENADQLEVACSLLLQDAEEVEELLRQLPDDRLQQMKKWPIWRLRAGQTDGESLDKSPATQLPCGPSAAPD